MARENLINEKETTAKTYKHHSIGLMFLNLFKVEILMA